MLDDAMATFGLDAQFLRDIACGFGGPGDGTMRLSRNDGLVIQVSWAVVPATGTFRGGWIVRFLNAADEGFTGRIVECINNARRQIEKLSLREQQVLELLFDGRTNKAIALHMQISEKTVEKHRARIMQKLKVKSTARLFRLVSHAMLGELETTF